MIMLLDVLCIQAISEVMMKSWKERNTTRRHYMYHCTVTETEQIHAILQYMCLYCYGVLFYISYHLITTILCWSHMLTCFNWAHVLQQMCNFNCRCQLGYIPAVRQQPTTFPDVEVSTHDTFKCHTSG